MYGLIYNKTIYHNTLRKLQEIEEVVFTFENNNTLLHSKIG